MAGTMASEAIAAHMRPSETSLDTSVETSREAPRDVAREALSISRLRVTDFRSYDHAGLDLDARPVVLTGENGAGKTNLLEAVSLLVPGRGLRAVPFAELCRKRGAGGWAVAADVFDGQADMRIGTGIEPQEAGAGETRTRQVRIDGQVQSSAGVLAEYVRIVWLTPAMDRLFVEAASGRRRFLDRLVMGFDPSHGTRVNAYERAMRDRNRLLADNVKDASWLGALEAQMAEHGVAIAATRLDCVARLKGAIAATQEGAFPKALLALEGGLESDLSSAVAVDVEDQFARHLCEMRTRDQGAGRALDGPHRSDLLVRHEAKDMEADKCSTGEQKALLIGMILANARLLARHTGHAPLLLLDEVAAHLDRDRRAALFDEITALGAQAWMTGTDRSLFEAIEPRAQCFQVEAGQIRTVTNK
ncbi:MAG: DNA replication/repair protein RecF [Parvibaculaceae bacterium]|nr:DNA replication/repair protein RecF [Parvibaculaceae bacterium]